MNWIPTSVQADTWVFLIKALGGIAGGAMLILFWLDAAQRRATKQIQIWHAERDRRNMREVISIEQRRRQLDTIVRERDKAQAS